MHDGIAFEERQIPTAVLATGVMVVAALSLMCGVILDTVSRGRREAKRMRYLAIPSPAETSERATAQMEERVSVRPGAQR